MLNTYHSPESKNNKPIIGLIGTDKQGKGTTWRHALYGLSQLGYKVLGVTFPSYNTVGGLGAEINLSHKQIIEKLPELGINTTNWSKSVFAQVYSYVLDRSISANIIEDYIKQGYIVVTKRSSKATHAAYQKAFNNIPEKTTMGLEPFIPDPMVLMNMLSNKIRIEDFNEKGNLVLDEFESQNQDPVSKIQDKYTKDPQLVGAQYGFHIPYEESPQRLETILSGLSSILIGENIQRDIKQIQPITILGTEEAKWDFRTKEGLDYFMNNFTGKDLLESWFSHPFELVNNYEELFTKDGKLLSYPMSVKNDIDKIINNHKYNFATTLQEKEKLQK